MLHIVLAEFIRPFFAGTVLSAIRPKNIYAPPFCSSTDLIMKPPWRNAASLYRRFSAKTNARHCRYRKQIPILRLEPVPCFCCAFGRSCEGLSLATLGIVLPAICFLKAHFRLHHLTNALLARFCWISKRRFTPFHNQPAQRHNIRNGQLFIRVQISRLHLPFNIPARNNHLSQAHDVRNCNFAVVVQITQKNFLCRRLFSLAENLNFIQLGVA